MDSALRLLSACSLLAPSRQGSQEGGMHVGKILLKSIGWTALAAVSAMICTAWYFGAAWISGIVPLKGKSAHVPPAKPAAYLCEAAFHTDIALPLDGEAMNWRRELRGQLPAGLPRDTYLLFGWGDSVFFTKVLQPSDLTAGRAVSALAGLNPAAMRIVPVYGSDVRAVCEPLAGGRAAKDVLISEIRASLKTNSEGEYQSIATAVPGEILLAAKGRYSPYNTCNQWTARALGKAGLPRAAFAPLAWSVTRPLTSTTESPPER